MYNFITDELKACLYLNQGSLVDNQVAERRNGSFFIPSLFRLAEHLYELGLLLEK